MKAPFPPTVKFPLTPDFSENLRALARQMAANPSKPESVVRKEWARELANQSCAGSTIPEGEMVRESVLAYFEGVMTAAELETQLMFGMENHGVEEMLALMPKECGTRFRDSLAITAPEDFQYYHFGEIREFPQTVKDKIRAWQSTLPKP